ncbi:hypothetical protein Tco_0923308 [Tanacetum coccineum]|uniref:Reverse transcriptase domain-containing protein n=1 Tax=Tanacetum coccineum TaxID=301880 RepID=A0ABQ5D7S3_9ASTR
MQSVVEMFRQQEQAANLSTRTSEPSRHFNSICYDNDDDEESTIPLNEIISQITLSVAITPVLPDYGPEDLLFMRGMRILNYSEKESGKNSSPLDVLGGNSVIFSNPLFDSNDNFTSSDDESFPDEDVQEENFKTYSNPLFEFDDKYISSDALLVTHLSELNEDECFDPGGDEIEACLTSDSIPPRIDGADFDPKGDILLLEKLLNDDISFSLPSKELHFEGLKVIKSYIPPDFEDNYYDSEGDTIYLKRLLINDTVPNLPPGVFFDHDLKKLK